MQALAGQISLFVERNGGLLGNIEYRILNDSQQEVLKGNGRLSLSMRERSFNLSPTQKELEGMTFNASGGILGWRKLKLESSSGATIGVVKNTINFFGVRFNVETENGVMLYRIRQVIECALRKNEFEILSMQDVCVGKIIIKRGCCHPNSYKLQLVAPFDAANTCILLGAVFFLEDSICVQLVISLIFLLIELLIIAVVVGIAFSL